MIIQRGALQTENKYALLSTKLIDFEKTFTANIDNKHLYWHFRTKKNIVTGYSGEG